VLAIKGVESNENPMKKGYRLEHVSSGMYLGMSNSVVEPGVTALTMSDNFVTSQSLWYFRMKSEDRDEDGENSVIQFESDSPLYLQHSNTGWLTHIIPDKKNRLQSNFFGDKRDNIAGLRKDINMKDSMSLLQSDAHSMAQISRLMKLMKPLELFLKSRKMCAPNLKDACTDNLCNIVGMKICGSQACETEAQASPMQKRLKSTQMYVVGRGEILQGDPPNESDKSGDRTSTPIKQNSSPINRGSTPINRDRDSSSRQNGKKFYQKVIWQGYFQVAKCERLLTLENFFREWQSPGLPVANSAVAERFSSEIVRPYPLFAVCKKKEGIGKIELDACTCTCHRDRPASCK